ncbi:hypothetical protein MMC29_004065 [Sticta canariensis]|nr:hypothetical protein [Sticta canariensis]
MSSFLQNGRPWVPELWDADQIPQTTATMAIFRRGSPCLELVSVHKTFSATGTFNRGYIDMPGFSFCRNNFSIPAFEIISFISHRYLTSIGEVNMQRHIMRAPVPCRHHPHGCSHGRPGGSYRRYGNEDFRPAGPTQPLGSWLDGLPYPQPDQDSIEVLKNADALPARSNLRLSTEEAFGRAHQAIEHYRRTKVACLAPSQRHLYLTRRLPFMVFDQLDRELFRSVLKGNVHLKWTANMPGGIYAATCHADPPKRPRITIFLSEVLAEAPRVHILCTLVHQMMHAYFLQCCGYQAREGGSGGHDLCHGSEFRALLVTISHRCSLDGHQATAYLTNPLPIPPTSRPRARKRGSQHQSWSNCYASVPPMHTAEKVDDQNWRNMAIAKMRSLDDEPQSLPTPQSDISRVLEIMLPVRNEAPPAVPDFAIAKPRSPRRSEPNFYFIDPDKLTFLPPQPRSQFPFPEESYVELHFGSQVFPLARDRIASHLPWLAQSSCFVNNRFLVLPAWSDSTDLVILYIFLLRTPSSSSPTPRSDSAQFPVIGAHTPQFSAVVKAHVSVFHLALALEFKPLAVYAFNVLHSLRYTHENPIAVLERIYHPPESIPQIPGLREWTKSWLALRIPHDDGWEDYAARYPTNFDVIKEHPDWKAAYVALREKGTVLVTDLDAVEAEIAKSQAPPLYDEHPHSPPSTHHPWMFTVLPSTRQPTSGQDPTSAFFPPGSHHHWHDMLAGISQQADEKKREDGDRTNRSDERAERNWSEERNRSEKEQRRKRREEDARQKRKDEEERKIRKDTDEQIYRVVQMLRDANFVLGT